MASFAAGTTPPTEASAALAPGADGNDPPSEAIVAADDKNWYLFQEDVKIRKMHVQV